ncbi:SDR family NAD(P)-dependent oxidoreductase [Pseudonocardia sp. HH130630-07]|uniref:SDR family NAD(P)-dependent oxidoreductase n=1 Tax=Pseudonocardia sp. HH130630-07 TaxID=1690815 RepID=UPI0008153DB5|nr:SDR family oxidoreductase [Pseudonocardia sp. HH130630-07]ANY05271.1 oxidoreductase [Pseudonocardia sp. HH130630-07]
MSTTDLTGRVALVTGGARGLGAGAAEALAGAGARVMVADVLTEAGERTAARLEGAAFVELDVTDDARWAAAVAHTVQTLGRLDVVVNNAGIEVTQLIADAEPDAHRAMFDVNLLGTLLGTKHAFRAMRPGGAAGNGGTVINLASVAATIAFPAIAGYSATKSGVDRLTRVAAAESGKLGYGVRVNCLFPGLVATDMGMKLAVETAGLGLFTDPQDAVAQVVGLTPSGRLAEVSDIADAVVFLASDASRFVNGTGLAVDGGMGS